MNLKLGPMYIQNVAYSDHVVTLKDGKAGSVLVGSKKNYTDNQKWTFRPNNQPQGLYDVWCETTSGDRTVQYAKVDDSDTPSAGDKIDGSSSSTVWTITDYGDDQFTISVPGKYNRPLCWTLPNDTEGTEIVLKDNGSGATQFWTQVFA